MTVTEYLTERAIDQAKRNHGFAVTHQHVVNYLHGCKEWDALAEYLKKFDRVDDLATPLDGISSSTANTGSTTYGFNWVLS